MKAYAPAKIRNIALVGHQATGKTTLAEAILFHTGAIGRMGRVAEGNTTLDTAPEEIERQITIQAGLAFSEFHDHKINLIDTPGYEDFVGEVLAALDVVEGCCVLVRADGGVEVGTEKVWQYIRDRNLPTVFCMNRLDKENVSFDTCIEQMRGNFGREVLPLQLPLGEGESFIGVVDLVHEKALEFGTDGKGTCTETEIPGPLKEKAAKWRREILEAAAESDEALMEKYLETDTLSVEEAARGLALGVSSGGVFPVVCTSAEKNIGIPPLLRTFVDLIPNPEQRAKKTAEPDSELKADPAGPTAAMVFKNISESHVGDMLFVRVYRGALEAGKDIYNSTRSTDERLGQLFFLQGKNRKDTPQIAAGDMGAIVKLKHSHIGDSLCARSAPVKLQQTEFPKPSVFSAIASARKGEEDKIGTGLGRLKEEDPTFDVQVNSEIKQTVIAGQGELHLDVVIGRLKKRYGVDVVMSKPRIPFKETIKKTAQAQGKYKKQTGGRGQYGDVWVKVEPVPRGQSFEFVDAIVGGVVPNKFIPAVQKGIVAAMADGVLAGYPIVDVKATLYDGSYHSVDSSEMAFKIAGSMAFKKAVQSANLILLEPIMDVEVKVPEEYMGDVMGDLSGRRGKIQGMDRQGKFNVIKCQAPLTELYRYATHLRSITQGRGMHKREFSHYEEVPHEIAMKIIDEAKKEKEQDAK